MDVHSSERRFGSTAFANLCYNILIEDGAAAVQAVDAKAVTPALERVVEANTLLSGLGFESGGICVAHSVHNGLTSQPNHTQYTHGEKVSFGIFTQLVLEGRPQEEIKTILHFCKRWELMPKTTRRFVKLLKGIWLPVSPHTTNRLQEMYILFPAHLKQVRPLPQNTRTKERNRKKSTTKSLLVVHITFERLVRGSNYVT
jgi:hypothetical protein